MSVAVGDRPPFEVRPRAPGARRARAAAARGAAGAPAIPIRNCEFGITLGRLRRPKAKPPATDPPLRGTAGPGRRSVGPSCRPPGVFYLLTHYCVDPTRCV